MREVRNNGELLVEGRGRSLVVRASDVSAVAERKRRPGGARKDPTGGPEVADAGRQGRGISAEIDLHGLTVEEALHRLQDALNDALLRDVGELRVVHGRSGGRIRAAVHRRLQELSSVRGFRLDPHNEGVTIVSL